MGLVCPTSYPNLSLITLLLVTRWQWRAFLVGGGSAAWLYLYGIYYYMTQLQLSFVSTIVYFGYLSLLALLDFLVTGTIGFVAS